MGIFLALIVILLGLLTLVPYALTRVVLWLTLACYSDKTTPQAASGVRGAAFLCAGLGLVFSGLVVRFFWFDLGGTHASLLVPVCAVIAGLPLLSLGTAIAVPLKVQAPSQSVYMENGFTRF